MTIDVETGIRRLVIELPIAQHQKLKIEAAERGVSLKALAMERLAQPRADKPGEQQPRRA